jgi:hypothetical protein
VAIDVVCPHGHKLLLGDQFAGRRFTCPHCQATVDVPGTAPAAVVTAAVREPPEARPANVIPEEFRPLLREEPPAPIQGWARRRLVLLDRGLWFHYAKLIVYVICVIVFCYGLITLVIVSTVRREPFTEKGPAGIVLLYLVLFMLFLPPALGLIGSVLCCGAPPEARARALILASLVLDALAVTFPILNFGQLRDVVALFDATPSWSVLDFAAAVVSPLCSVAGFACFLLFLRQVAIYLTRPVAADEALTILVQYGLLALGALVSGAVVPALVDFTAVAMEEVPMVEVIVMFVLGPLLVALAVALLVFWFKLVFRIIHLIGTLREALRTPLGA